MTEAEPTEAMAQDYAETESRLRRNATELRYEATQRRANERDEDGMAAQDRAAHLRCEAKQGTQGTKAKPTKAKAQDDAETELRRRLFSFHESGDGITAQDRADLDELEQQEAKTSTFNNSLATSNGRNNYSPCEATEERARIG